MAVFSLSAYRDRRQSVFNLDSEKANFPLEDFKSYLVAGRGLGMPTARVYSRTLTAVLRRIGSVAPDKHELMQYVAAMSQRYSYKHIANTQRAIEEYTAYLGRPIRFKRPRKPKQEINEVLSEAEVAVILAVGCSNITEQAMIAVLAYTGVRNAELCSLKVSDIAIAGNFVRVRKGKGSKDRKANISGEGLQILMEYLKEYPRGSDSYLFTALRHGTRYAPASLRKMVRKIAKRAQIKKRVHPHIFRHTLAVNMMRRGADVYDVQHQLGHEDVLTTIQTYLRGYKPNARASYMKFCPSYA